MTGRRLRSAMLCLSVAAAVASCGGGEGGGGGGGPVTPVVHTLTSIAVTVSGGAAGPASVPAGGTLTLVAQPRDETGNPIAATVVWSSSSSAVATVSGAGVVSAISAGSASITAASGSIAGTIALTVTPPSASRSLALSGRSERGATATVQVKQGSAVVTPGSITISVQPADAATIQGSTVTFLTTGSVTISANVDGETLTIQTTVAAPPIIYLDAIAGGNRDVYAVALDGQQLVRLTTAPADDAKPSVSAATLVFSSYRDGNAELYSIATNGTGERRLTSTATVNELLPALSVDGRAIAFVKDSAGTARVWVSTDGAATARVATPGSAGSPDAVESTPAWLPQSDRFLFVSTATPSGNAGLFVVAAAGGSPAPIAGSGSLGAEVDPTVSPDGTRVAFASSRGGATGLYIRDIASGVGSTLLIAPESSGEPAWLADGRIVFVSFSAAGSSLRWVDPAAPADVHTIPLPTLTSPRHPAAPRP